MSKQTYDFILIGGGIIGLTISQRLKTKYPESRILLIEKEAEIAQHASGRNSGVLHAGFYYTADSLKARFTVAGNQIWKTYCRERGLPLNECGKLVVASDQEELKKLFELESRGKRNGSTVSIISEQEAREFEPHVITCEKALWSPDTATVDPGLICQSLKKELTETGVEISLATKYLAHRGSTLKTSRGEFEGGKIINCAGLYADKVAQDFGFGASFTIIPFKGLYLKYKKNKTDIRTNIYPVPNLKNPFLGVHFTKTVDGTIKIGPTAIPAFWRENYTLFERFNLNECAGILCQEARLFLANSFGFRSLAFEEMRKYIRPYLIGLAKKMATGFDPHGFGEFTAPGIRAQLLNLRTRELVQDFVVEGDEKSVHILNAVSPALTCSFPFAEHVIEKYVMK